MLRRNTTHGGSAEAQRAKAENIKNTNQKHKNIFTFLICVFDFWYLIFEIKPELSRNENIPSYMG